MAISFFKSVLEITLARAGNIGLNTVLLGLSDVFGKVVLFLLTVLYARTYGVLEYGSFSFAFSLASILVIISDPGINQFIIREIAAQRRTSISALSGLFSLKIALGLPFSFGTVIYSWLVGLGGSSLFLCLIMTAFFWLDSLHQFTRNIFRAQERMDIDMFSRIAERTSLFVVAAIGMLMGLPPLLVVAIFPLVALLSILCDVIRYKPFSLAEAFPHESIKWGEIARALFPFALSHLVFVMYFRVDTLMLQILRGYEAVGYYNAAYRVFEGMQVIPVAVSGSLYPAFSRLTARKDPYLIPVVKRTAWFLVPIALLLSLIFLLSSGLIVRFLYGASFSPSGKVLATLSVGILFNYFYMVFTYLLAAFNLQRRVVVFGLAVLILNVALNLVLIPLYGPFGAAMATVACEAVMSFVVASSVLHVLKRA